MLIGALGDIHGAFDTVHEIMERHADVPLWVQVGDVASNDGVHVNANENFGREVMELFTLGVFQLASDGSAFGPNTLRSRYRPLFAASLRDTKPR